jgi:hypothetical protein
MAPKLVIPIRVPTKAAVVQSESATAFLPKSAWIQTRDTLMAV